MEDIIKNVSNLLETDSISSNSRELALGLSFDADGIEQLEQSKKRKNSPNTEMPEAKKVKNLESGVNINPLLLEMQLKKNEARARAKKATEEEEEIMAAGPNSHRLKAVREAKKKKEEERSRLISEGKDPERLIRLHETAETAEIEKQRKDRPRAPDSTTLGSYFNYLIFLQF